MYGILHVRTGDCQELLHIISDNFQRNIMFVLNQNYIIKKFQ